ncbi:unnamed protein product [Brachionus calyciflorus]|uniref:Uncharacterized protein n=1 Tax=Brachionus calyciflorus TaxID=104777 RepID=A0A813ZT92_9BILA|nr:unnamed protein product [Brachionus calyciflorus]
MLQTFLSPKVSKKVEESVLLLDKLIKESPILSEKTEKTLSAYIYLQNNLDNQTCNEENNELDHGSQNKISNDDEQEDENYKTIKKSSPFYKHFSKLKDDLLINMLTNGTIEKFFAPRKKLVSKCKEPAFYVNKTIKDAFGQSLRSQKYFDNANGSSSGSECSNDTNSEDKHLVVDKWGKKRSKKNKKVTGFYNKSHSLKIINEFKESLVPPYLQNDDLTVNISSNHQNLTIIKLDDTDSNLHTQPLLENPINSKRQIPSELEPVNKKLKKDCTLDLVVKKKKYNLIKLMLWLILKE